MKNSIFFRLFSGFFLVTLLLSSLILAFSFGTIRRHNLALLTGELKDLGFAAGVQTLSLAREKRLAELGSLVRKLDDGTHKRFTVIDPSGTVLADSENNASSMENHRARPEIRRALEGGTGSAIRFSSTMKEEMLYVALPLGEPGAPAAVLRVSMPLRDVNILLARIKTRIVTSALLIIAVSLVVSLLLARGLSLPIKRLGSAARAVAGGDFDVKIHIDGTDELKGLAGSFNHMTGRIKALFSELSDRKKELDTIISSIQEGLFVFDPEGRITLANESFRKIVREERPEGRFYWELVRVPPFEQLARRVRENGQSASAEVEREGRTYLCSITLIASRGDRIALLHDITRLKDLERLKKDFVANVSHELRTPLTAIRGFVETLEEDAAGESRRYLDIIGRHTERLINIVEDLLLLSRLEDRGYELEAGPVQLGALIADTARVFEQKIKDKGLRLRLDLPGETLPVRADAFRLEQALLNLIDNAVKYTEQGEIAVSLRQDAAGAVITVSDTGIGIPAEHLDRIFERFYVADKSRSRKAGGTGLGLSIVKHIVLLHNGNITVESAPGAGSRFTITLPAA